MPSVCYLLFLFTTMSNARLRDLSPVARAAPLAACQRNYFKLFGSVWSLIVLQLSVGACALSLIINTRLKQDDDSIVEMTKQHVTF